MRFDFLGYCFGPKAVKNKKTKEVFTNFTPRVSASSLKSMRKSIRELNLRRRTHVALADIAQEINPILLARIIHDPDLLFHLRAVHARHLPLLI
jgi:hypothetical protein